MRRALWVVATLLACGVALWLALTALVGILLLPLYLIGA